MEWRKACQLRMRFNALSKFLHSGVLPMGILSTTINFRFVRHENSRQRIINEIEVS